MNNSTILPGLRFALLIAVFSTLSLNLSAQSLNLTFSHNTLCIFNLNAQVQLCANVTGGVPPYNYDWGSPLFLDSCVAMSIYSFYNYLDTLTVTDNVGNSITLPIPFHDFFEVFVDAIVTPENCSNQNGSIQLIISGGQPPYNINWSTGQVGGTLLSNLSNGDYQVTVTDANGCSGFNMSLFDSLVYLDAMNIYVPLSVPFTYTTHIQHFDCPNPGTMKIGNLSGGAPPYQFAWSTNPPQFTDSVALFEGGFFNVTISDGTPGCSITEHFFLRNLNPLQISTTSQADICYNQSGSATVVANSGTPPYNYEWNSVPPQFTQTAVNLGAGVYIVTVTDQNNCSNKQNVYVNGSSPIQPNVVITHEVCSNGQGSLNLSPQLGNPPYSFSWSTGATTAGISNLSEGQYSYTITDNANCQTMATVYVGNLPPFNINITHSPVTCFGPGTAEINLSGGTPPYSFVWSSIPPQLTSVLTTTTSGYYFVTITDASGCSAIREVFIGYNSAVNLILTPNITLCGFSNGSVTTTVTGGTPPYTYSWSDGSTSANLTNKPGGLYSVTVTDVTGCSISKSTTVRTDPGIYMGYSVTPASCIFTNDGSASVTVTGGVPPYTYFWSNGQNTPTATGLVAGWRYTCRVTDANGCSNSILTDAIGYVGLSCAAEVFGKVLMDNNANCVEDGPDLPMFRIPVRMIPGNRTALTNSAGEFRFFVPPGNHAINHVPPYHTFPLCPATTVTLNGLTAGQVVQQDFFDTVRIAHDFSVSFSYVTVPRPGYDYRMVIHVANLGNLSDFGILHLIYDDDVNFVATNWGNHVHNSTNRQLTFDLGIMGQGTFRSVNVDFNVPASVALGTVVKDSATILPIVGDVNFTNNVFFDSILVVGSFDPNDKGASPFRGTFEGPHFIGEEDTLIRYTIRFQNVGTWYAENVAILDTLDDLLLPWTISDIVATHSVRVDFFHNQYLAFFFDNIFLPDSTTDEPGSHGAVSFTIKRQKGLQPGTEIANRAGIYFDFNAPIITNTVKHIKQFPDGIANIRRNDKVIAYPNPTGDKVRFSLSISQASIQRVEIFDLAGKSLFSIQENVANVSGLQPGLYFFRMEDKAGNVYTGKFVKQ